MTTRTVGAQLGVKELGETCARELGLRDDSRRAGLTFTLGSTLQTFLVGSIFPATDWPTADRTCAAVGVPPFKGADTGV